jgi:5-methyltetrahydropteroyltriglutamate--homocysteine methyltransferase
VIDLGDPAVEAVEQVATRIRTGLARVAPDRFTLAPDWRMKYLPRKTAFGKLKALSDGAHVVRSQIPSKSFHCASCAQNTQRLRRL